MEILHINRMKEVAKERKIEIGIITTPAEAAQNVVDLLVDAEVRGILNFAPTHVAVPEGFVVKDVFFTTVLDNLAYLLSNATDVPFCSWYFSSLILMQFSLSELSVQFLEILLSKKLIIAASRPYPYVNILIFFGCAGRSGLGALREIPQNGVPRVG